MRYVKDKTGRFNERPHYEPQELDHACEKIIVDFIRSKNRTLNFPLDTEDIKSLIERDTDYLDCYADLSEYGSDVEGVTIFQPGKKPIVKISKLLTENDRYENRLRTTLTHEYGHVHFHSYLFTLGQDQGSFFRNHTPQSLVSKRENIINAPVSDWMEWQADRLMDNIWPLNTGFMRTTKDKEAYKHPAIFPDELAYRHIISWSNEGDTVLDPFMGSGTTGKQAKLLKRNFIGIECVKEYFRIAKQRIKNA